MVNKDALKMHYSKTSSLIYIHVPILWIKCNGPWLVQASPEQNFSECAIQITNFNAIGLRVSPVQLFPQPITS